MIEKNGKILCVNTVVPQRSTEDYWTNYHNSVPFLEWNKTKIYVWNSEREPNIGDLVLGSREDISQQYHQEQEQIWKDWEDAEGRAYADYIKRNGSSGNSKDDWEAFFWSHDYETFSSSHDTYLAKPPIDETNRDRFVIDVCWLSPEEIKEICDVGDIHKAPTVDFHDNDPDKAMEAYNKIKHTLQKQGYSKTTRGGRGNYVEVVYSDADGKPCTTTAFTVSSNPKPGDLVMLSSNINDEERTSDEPNVNAVITRIVNDGDSSRSVNIIREGVNSDTSKNSLAHHFLLCMEFAGKENGDKLRTVMEELTEIRELFAKQLNIKGKFIRSAFISDNKVVRTYAVEIEKIINKQPLDKNEVENLAIGLSKIYGSSHHFSTWPTEYEDKIRNMMCGILYTAMRARAEYKYGIKDIYALPALYAETLLKNSNQISYNVISPKDAHTIGGIELINAVFTQNKAALCDEIDIIRNNLDELEKTPMFTFPDDWERQDCWSEVDRLVSEIDNPGFHENYKQIADKLEYVYGTRDIQQAIDIENEQVSQGLSLANRDNRNRGTIR